MGYDSYVKMALEGVAEEKTDCAALFTDYVDGVRT